MGSLSVGDAVATGGQVFAVDLALPAGGPVVRALDATTGRQDWITPLGGEAVTIDTPIVDGNQVFVGVAYDVTSSSLFALDRASGEIRWRFDRSDVLYEPVVGRSLVYTAAANAGEVLALDRRSGDRRWTFQTDNLVPSLFLEEGLLAGLSGGGTFFLLKRGTGHLRLQSATGDEVTESLLAVADGLGYVLGIPRLEPGLEGMALHAIDIRSGRERWRVDRALLGHEEEFSTGDGAIYIIAFETTDKPGHIAAFEANTGKERWRYGGDFESGGPPLWDDGAVFVTGERARRGSLAALDAESGEILWSAPYAGQAISAPEADDLAVYLGTDAGQVIGVDRITGEVVWRFEADGPVLDSPVAHRGSLFVTSSSRP